MCCVEVRDPEIEMQLLLLMAGLGPLRSHMVRSALSADAWGAATIEDHVKPSSRSTEPPNTPAQKLLTDSTSAASMTTTWYLMSMTSG
jgi:hypothetical protein